MKCTIPTWSEGDTKQDDADVKLIAESQGGYQQFLCQGELKNSIALHLKHFASRKRKNGHLTAGFHAVFIFVKFLFKYI